MKKLNCLFVCLSTLASLSGCTGGLAFNPVSMTKEAENQSNFLEQYQINTILHNIMRSAHNEPLTFMRINGVAGSWGDSFSDRTETGISGQPKPDSVIGSVAPIGVALTNDGNNGANYSLDVADDSVYSSVFLNPIPTKYIEFFVDNHKPKTLVYSLLIDRIIITDGNKQEVYDNNPLLNSYEKFHSKLYELIGLGLTADENHILEPIGTPTTLDSIKKTYGVYYKQSLAQKGIGLVSVDSPKANLFQLVKKIKGSTRMCVPRTADTESKVTKDFGPSMLCSPATDEATSLAEEKNSRKTKLSFRSTSGIFDYLGEVALAGLQDPPYVVTLPPLDPQDKFRFPKEEKDYVLLNVKRVNFFSDDNYAQITTRRGIKYAIPDADAGYSRMTIRLVSQIMKLNAIPGDAYSRAPQPLLIQTIPTQAPASGRYR